MELIRRSKEFMFLLALLTGVCLGGCAATQVALSKKDLDVQTRMSDTIFLDPVSPDKRTLYIQVRNTSDKPNFDIEGPIRQAIEAKGYRVTNNPEQAHYHLLANVLSVEKASPSAAESALNAGYGGAFAVGAISGGLITESFKGAGIGGLAAGAAAVVANSLVKDVSFMVISDVQISEKAKEGVLIRQDTKLDAKQGSSGSSRQTMSEVSDRKTYRTRVVSTANKVNLKYETASPLLTSGLSRSLAGLF